MDDEEIFTTYGYEELAMTEEEKKEEQQRKFDQVLMDEEHERLIASRFPNFDNGHGEGNDKTETQTETQTETETKAVMSREPQNKKSKKQEPVTHLQKHSDNRVLAEAVMIGKIPYFLVSENGTIIPKKQILDGDRVIQPFVSEMYINRPYTFESLSQVEQYVEETRNETLDSLYKLVKSIWKKYIDADDFHISICSADTIFTYFQDKIGLTHYLFFVGNAGSGKSNNLTVFQFLSYRNMTSTGLTYANIYQFLGSAAEGIGTICEDEADSIDEDNEKMKIYKNGYTTGRPTTKTDTTYGRKQFKFNNFCFKVYFAYKIYFVSLRHFIHFFKKFAIFRQH